MPRSLVLGNGSILVGYDKHGQVRDFYYPHVGQENHTPNCVNRIGVWIDGKFSWLKDPGWIITIDYRKETLVAKIKAENKDLAVTLSFTDTVYNEKNIYIRNVVVKNDSPKTREFRIFFNQQFEISGSTHGNSAYYDPNLDVVIHYRGRRVFLIAGDADGHSFTDYGVGLFNTEGKEGTWRDAEDGTLSKNPVEHGLVDSTISFHQKIKGGGEFCLNYWIIAAESIPLAKGLHKFTQIKTTSHMIETTTDYWRAWVNKLDTDFGDLGPDITDLFKKSLLIIRTHVDNDGAIIASCDSDILQYGRDTYGYMWPRDAAITSIALDMAGYFEATNRFFVFCNEVVSDEGYLFHKYMPDKSVGSSWHPWSRNGKKQLAIQEDETAIVLHALWTHYMLHRNLEFVERVYNSFIKKTADFLYFYRDEQTGLPYGSYDLWEEKFGTSTYTASTVYGALVSASKFAHILGKDYDSKKYFSGAQGIRDAILKHLYDPETGYFHKLIDLRQSTPTIDRTIDISSFYGPFRFGVLKKDDVRLKNAYKVVEKNLCCEANIGEIGGAIRYENDVYRSVDKKLSGNPWLITTLWLTQYKISQAKSKKDLTAIKEELDWIKTAANEAGLMPEQLNPYTKEPISVAPLTWSHAEFVLTIFNYVNKFREIYEKK